MGSRLQRYLFYRELLLEVIDKRYQLIHQDSRGPAAEIEVREGKSSPDIEVQLLPQIDEILSGFILLK